MNNSPQHRQRKIYQKNNLFAMIKKILIGFIILCFTISCDNELRCERHFIPQGFVGKVTIFYNQKNGQKTFDRDGCIVYKISNNGACYSSLPLISGTAYPNKTFRYFEVITEDSVIEIPEFNENEFLKDTATNNLNKYIFYLSSGYEAPDYVYQYYVDYGINYRSHFY